MATMSDEMRKAVEAMQEAVDEEMERKAKLGYKAVIADKHGRPKAVSAKHLVRKRRAELAAERSGNNGK
jgi:hypothetical protein